MLLTRQGKEFTGTISHDEKGRPFHTVAVACDRCHVIGGQRLWIMGIENSRPYSRTGFECWTCGNTGVRKYSEERLYTAEALAKTNKAAETRAARKAEADRIARELADAERAAKVAVFNAQNAEFIAKLAGLDGDFWNGFRDSFLQRATAPTERQAALVEAEVAKRATNAASAYVGAIGDKIELALTVERVIVFSGGLFGNKYLTIARDQAGNVVTYKGQVNLGISGANVTLKATVAEHALYNGVQQTRVMRPKEVVVNA